MSTITAPAPAPAPVPTAARSNARVRALRPAGRPPSTLHDMALAVVRLYLEVEAGLRPWGTMRGILHPHLLLRLAPIWVRQGTAAGHVLSFTGTQTSPDCYEGVAIVRRGTRCGAIGLELRRSRERWQVTQAIRPEDGQLPTLVFDFDEEDSADH